ncbi:hypothetical protein AB0I53_26990 [Saccharopolyspora sp. NPDC050389]|uniref:hypothetical protein n=1 Tax=Saccharopolyspora sp. NPDC050389 TaxID=3155516 RepID=UPI0033CDE339
MPSEHNNPLLNHDSINDQNRTLKKADSTVSLVMLGAAVLLGLAPLLFAGPGSNAGFFVLIGAVFLVVGFVIVRARKKVQSTQYRVMKPGSSPRIAGKIVAALVVFFGVAVLLQSIDVPSAFGVVLFGGLIGVIVWLRTEHEKEWLAFKADAHGLVFGPTKVSWPEIGQLVTAAGMRPGTVEIGVRPVPGANIAAGERIDGAVLGDLPAHAVVPEDEYRPDRLRWAVDRFGRTDIQLVERTPEGEQVVVY